MSTLNFQGMALMGPLRDLRYEPARVRFLYFPGEALERLPITSAT